MLSIHSAGNHCLVVSKSPDISTHAILSIYNSIGIVLENMAIEFIPEYIGLSKNNVIIANDQIVMHWQLKTRSLNTNLSTLEGIQALSRIDKEETKASCISYRQIR